MVGGNSVNKGIHDWWGNPLLWGLCVE
jgi:hypothetical protein